MEKADVAFLMDASESMTEDDFEKQKSFVTKVAESFHMAPKTTQFALVTYSSSAKLHIFKNFQLVRYRGEPLIYLEYFQLNLSTFTGTQKDWYDKTIQ